MSIKIAATPPTGDGVTTSFSLASVPVNPVVVVGGLVVDPANVTITGASVAFATAAFPLSPTPGAPPSGDSVFVLADGIVAPIVTPGTLNFDTAKNVLNDAAIELGLISSPLSDPYASGDQNIVQLTVLLKSLGRELCMKHNWTHLEKEYTLPTVSGQATYALPGDFRKWIDQSSWNRTSQFPVDGPLSPQEWQAFKVRTSQATLYLMFRVWQGAIQVYPTPGATTQTLAFEYASRFWVQPINQSGPATDQPTASTDTLWFDPLLLTRGIKRAFLRAKGFDASSADAEFAETLSRLLAEDSPGKRLRLDGQQSRSVNLLLGDQSVPLTGFGS